MPPTPTLSKSLEQSKKGLPGTRSGSPFLSPLNDVYLGFFELISSAVSAALGTVRAREDERRRAEALAEIDRAKTAFFSNVSHEFRTPLTLMLGPPEESLARADELPQDERERVTLAHRNGQRLLKLVNALLDFSRLEAGRAQASYEPTDIAALAAELASNFRSAIEHACVALIVDAPALPEPVCLDREMWEKVILNLLSNAFKFTYEGEIRVTVRPSPDGKAVQVVVADTGIGIPKQELPRLFERFHRIEGAKGRSFEGSGIGLALVLKLHGGELGVESESGRGSMFTIPLPFGAERVPPGRTGASTGAGSTAIRAGPYVDEAISWLSGADGPEAMPATAPEGAASGSRSRVLLADDNADMRGYVARLLEAEGFAVEAVTDARRRSRQFGHGRPTSSCRT